MPPPVWVIYDHPKDHPSHFVVRRWIGETPDNKALLCETLEQARESLPPGLFNLGRFQQDDACILESWI